VGRSSSSVKLGIDKQLYKALLDHLSRHNTYHHFTVDEGLRLFVEELIISTYLEFQPMETLLGNTSLTELQIKMDDLDSLINAFSHNAEEFGIKLAQEFKKRIYQLYLQPI
jgi:hypothetical protein